MIRNGRNVRLHPSCTQLATTRPRVHCRITNQPDFSSRRHDSLRLAVSFLVCRQAHPIQPSAGMTTCSVFYFHRRALPLCRTLLLVSPPHCFSIQGWMQLKNTRRLQWRQMAVHRILFSVRARMQFFIDNLQYYLQVFFFACFSAIS